MVVRTHFRLHQLTHFPPSTANFKLAHTEHRQKQQRDALCCTTLQFCRMIICNRLCLWTIILCAIPLLADAGFFRDKTPASTMSKKSLFHVDPQNIIRLICKHGGVVLPESIKKDIDIITSVCECDETSLDLINKELIIKGFRVSLPMKKNTRTHAREKTALRVGRFSLSWDSFLRPCIDIEVEDVDILIEFINLVLSKNNW